MPVNVSKVLEIPHLVPMERVLLPLFGEVVVNSQMQAEYFMLLGKKEKMYLHRLSRLDDLSWSICHYNSEHLLRLLEFGEESTSDSCPLSFFRSQQEEVLKS